MASRGTTPSVSSMGTDSQDSEDMVPPGTTGQDCDTSSIQLPKAKVTPTPKISLKGIENAKKRLRAFSIQKKTPITPIAVHKPISTGGTTTVLIGKLSSVKSTPKPDVEPDHKKPPKPPKPGASKKNLQDSYTDLQKRTLAEIEDMKRKMELVELGIPLGLICPSSTSDKAMPTKAMPPIKSFLDASKVDEIIREAKKAKAEGREFKFDYQKLLPDYDNPFQRKKEDPFEREPIKEEDDRTKSKSDRDKSDSRRSDKYERRHSDHRKDDRDKERNKEKSRSKDKNKEREKEKEKARMETKKVVETKKPLPKDSDLNLNEYLVCDSWSLDNEDKTFPSPSVDCKNAVEKARQAAEIFKQSLTKKDAIQPESPKPVKMEKLQPVMDSFKFEIDPNEDEALDMFDEESDLEKFARQSTKKDPFDSPIDMKLFDYDQDMSKEGVIDANDDNFLESVINEIKQENMSDDTSQDKGLVEYDISPKDYEDKNDTSQGSVTPELDDRMKDLQSSAHHYSDGYRSTESGYKSNESVYKSTERDYKSPESYKAKQQRYRPDSRQTNDSRISIEKDLDAELANKMSKVTRDSLETWSFVLKICQPLLFRHDKNKCYKETHTAPKIWYTENPKICSCVKDRSVVYEELEMCKMGLVDRIYGCDQISDEPFPKSRTWYPRVTSCTPEAACPPMASEWETEDQDTTRVEDKHKSLTPQKTEEVYLDREYQRFMEAVWPDVAEEEPEDPSRSTTPVRLESKKKITEEKEKEERKKTKKIKLSSEGWSQESDVEEEPESHRVSDPLLLRPRVGRVPSPEQCKKIKEKARKRKHSTSSETSSSDSDDDSKKKKKSKKVSKKLKAKLAKRRRMSKKLKKHLKEKEKKKKKLQSKPQGVSDDSDDGREKKKGKKAKKKKQLKKKRLQKKKKAKVETSSSSSTSSSSTDSESDVERKKKIRKKEVEARKKKKDKKKRKQSSDSNQSEEELFDVNVLNNIKTERLTDDEKMADFSPRRQKPREIINVKELQNDFMETNIHVKQEKLDESSEMVVDKKESEKESKEEVVPDVPCEESKPTPEPVKAVIKEPSPEPIEEMPVPPIVESDIIPLPEEPKSVQNVEVIAMPPEVKPIQTIEQSFSYADAPNQSELYSKGLEADCDEKFADAYENGNYEMYEQMAMAYQSDVASQGEEGIATSGGVSQRIETVVRRRGEIKCDWRPGDRPAAVQATRPSRWGLKPSEVNIVLTGGPSSEPVQEHFPIRSVLEPSPVYEIQSLANRTDNTNANNSTGYDEAYMDTYGAADRLQYGDCFGPRACSLDERIRRVLRDTVLGEVAKETDDADADKDTPEKGILITKTSATRNKRVSFADGYRPGQDSDVEEPPAKKRKKVRRRGCAWPCPASHADHVPLWDALPPPPPPASPPPPSAARAARPPLHLLRRRPPPPLLAAPMCGKPDLNAMPPFMPPEPPPGLLNFP